MHNNKNLNLKSGDEGIAWEAGFDPYPSTPPPPPPPPLNIAGKYYQLFEERVLQNVKVSHGD